MSGRFYGRSVTVQRHRHSGNLKVLLTNWRTDGPTNQLTGVGAKDAYECKKANFVVRKYPFSFPFYDCSIKAHDLYQSLSVFREYIPDWPCLWLARIVGIIEVWRPKVFLWTKKHISKRGTIWYKIIKFPVFCGVPIDVLILMIWIKIVVAPIGWRRKELIRPV